MKQLYLLAVVLFIPNLQAAEKSAPVATAVAAVSQPSKSLWATELKEPQGFAIAPDGNILLADYGTGRILKYSRDGKQLAVLAEGLKSPSQIVVVGNRIFASERKANRIIEVGTDGKVTPVGEEIVEPMGLISDGSTLFAVAHTTSKIFRLNDGKWDLMFTAPLDEGDTRRYGYRCLAYDRGALLLSDEVGEEVLILTQNGRLASWAKGIGDPSGITIGPDGAVYVTDESEGGRLIRINNIGQTQIVAEGLGRPRGVLFVDAKTALVSDRNGKVWKLSFPA